VETGNVALKTLPYGGIYLVGGVTIGLIPYLISTDTFIKNYEMKGRMEPVVKKCPVLIVKKEAKVGILGAEEKAYRIIKEQY
jgi:glucokinase